MGPILPSKRHIFICHNSQDKEFVKKVVKDLHTLSVHVWFDMWEMAPGSSLIDTISNGIEISTKFAIVLSPDSIKSKWCQREIELASKLNPAREFIFINYAIKHPDEVDHLHIDFNDNYYAALVELVAFSLDLNLKWTADLLSEKIPENIEEVKEYLTDLGWNKVHLIDTDAHIALKHILKKSGLNLPNDLFKIIIQTKSGETREYLY